MATACAALFHWRKKIWRRFCIFVCNGGLVMHEAQVAQLAMTHRYE
jgi:hypothetical protein